LVFLNLCGLRVNISIQFHNQPMFVTAKIHNEIFNYDLTFKLQPEHSMIAQKQPGTTFNSCVLLPHLSCAVKQFSICRHRVSNPLPALRADLSRRERGAAAHAPIFPFLLV
jgi:hypothetical protein